MTRRGFTLLELLIALAIIGALLAILFGGLRVGVAAWRQGEDRAEVHAHLRSLSEVFSTSLAAVFPYRQAPPEGGAPLVQFQGEPDRLSFVTLDPPLPASVPIPFTAVTFSRRQGDRPGLAVIEKAMPNFEPFSQETEPLLVDPAVSEVAFRYLRPNGDWEERWDGAAEKGLPQAVEIRLTVSLRGQPASLPPLAVFLPVRSP